MKISLSNKLPLTYPIQLIISCNFIIKCINNKYNNTPIYLSCSNNS